MKINRFLLAAAITMAVAACSADVTAPDAMLQLPAHSLENTATDSTTTPTSTVDDGGHIGSGVGK